MVRSSARVALQAITPSDEPREGLTIELLKQLVPVFQAGRKAALELAEHPPASPKQRSALSALVAEGDQAAERLFLAGQPLIKMIARKAFHRRSMKASATTLLDVEQEASAGFLKGLTVMNVAEIRSSATNYLGQWMNVEIDRNLPALENDFSVCVFATNQMRRLHAITHTLEDRLGREPTVDEIVEESKVPQSGRTRYLSHKNTGKTEIKGISATSVRDFLTHQHRTGAQPRLESATWDDGSGPPAMTGMSPLVGVESGDPSLAVAEAAQADAMVTLMTSLMLRMGLCEVEREIIARRFGLSPFNREFPIASIARDMHVSNQRITKTVRRFEAEMVNPHGPLPDLLGSMPWDDVDALGLSWLAARVARNS